MSHIGKYLCSHAYVAPDGMLECCPAAFTGDYGALYAVARGMGIRLA